MNTYVVQSFCCGVCDLWMLLREARDADLAATLALKLNVEDLEKQQHQEEQDMLYARNLMVSQ